MAFPRHVVAGLLLLGSCVCLVPGCGREQEPKPTSTGVTEDGTPRRAADAAPVQVRPLSPLRVRSFDVRLLGTGTQLGRPGDLLLTFLGEGFLATATNPRMLLSEDLIFERTEISASGGELFVVLPRERLAEIAQLQPSRVVIENPGSERAGLDLPATGAFDPDPSAPHVRVIYRKSGPVREDVRE